MGQQNEQKYLVIDTKTQQPVGKPYHCVRRARARRDALDMQYGAVRYRVVAA